MWARKRKRPNSSESTAVIVRAPHPRLCGAGCTFERDANDDFLFVCTESKKPHPCGIGRCNAQAPTPLGPWCLLLGILIAPPNTALVTLGPTPISGEAFVADEARRAQLDVLAETKRREQLDSRLLHEDEIATSFGALNRAREKEASLERLIALKQYEAMTAQRQRNNDPDDSHRCTSACEFVGHGAPFARDHKCSDDTCGYIHHACLADAFTCIKFGRVHLCGKRCTMCTEEAPRAAAIPSTVRDKFSDGERDLRFMAENRTCMLTGRMLDTLTGALNKFEKGQMRRDRSYKPPADAPIVRTVSFGGGDDSGDDDGDNKNKGEVVDQNGDTAAAADRRKRDKTYRKHLTIAEDTIRDLLFSNKRREHDRAAFAKAQLEAEADVKQYRRACSDAGKKENTSVMRIRFLNKLRRLTVGHVRLELQADERKVSYYAKRCLDFWCVMEPDLLKAHVVGKFHEYVVNYLYMLCESYSFQGHVLIEADPYIAHARMPVCNALEQFNVANGRLTVNRRLLLKLAHAHYAKHPDSRPQLLLQAPETLVRERQMLLQYIQDPT